MKNNIICRHVTFAAVLLLFTVSACGKQPSAPLSSPRTVADREGNVIEAPEKVDKIISMAPSVTETLIHLGLGDKLVAVDEYSKDIAGLPENLPAYDIMSPDTESIAALSPDIIFATAMSKADGDDPYRPLRDLGVVLTYIPSSASIGDIKEDIRFIGKITGKADEAEGIVKEMERDISSITDAIKGRECGTPVYFEVEGAPHICSFGEGVFLNEMLELLGARNIFGGMDGWVAISEETVINENPDVIFTNVGYVDNPVNEILDRNGWKIVNAVKNKQVYMIDVNASSRPNEYITVAFAQMAEALYPGLFD